MWDFRIRGLSIASTFVPCISESLTVFCSKWLPTAGFDTDEHIDHLGESLAPPFLEPKREQIEAHLKPLHTHQS